MYDAPVAQRIEQLPSKQLVTGSIPVRGTIFFAVFAVYFEPCWRRSLGLSAVALCEGGSSTVVHSLLRSLQNSKSPRAPWQKIVG